MITKEDLAKAAKSGTLELGDDDRFEPVEVTLLRSGTVTIDSEYDEFSGEELEVWVTRFVMDDGMPWETRKSEVPDDYVVPCRPV